MKLRKIMLRLTGGISALLLLLPSCGGKPGPADGYEDSDIQGSAETTNTAENDAVPEGYFTSETAGAVDLSTYIIIRPNDASSDVIRVTTQLRAYIKEFCGYELKISTDTKATDLTANEILIGGTNREASVNAAKELKEKDWKVCSSENKIVLSAGCDGVLPIAIEWFKANCIQKGNSYACVGEGSSFAYDYPVKSIRIGENSITDAKLCYLSNDNIGIVDSAYMLAYHILDQYGLLLEVTTYKASAEYPQILVASNAQGGRYLPNGVTLNANQYVVMKSGTDILVIGKDEIAAEQGVQTIMRGLNNAADEVVLDTLCNNDVRTYDVRNDHLDLSDGADYRIMTFNIERYELNMVKRYTEALNSVLYYSPDVVGFQEYCANYTANLTPMLEANGYTVIGQDVSADNQNFTPLAYKTERFEAVASGWLKLQNEIQQYNGHNVTWAILKDRTTNEIFCVTNTHYFHVNDRTVANPERVKNSEELLVKVNELIAQYQCPVISIGDFNSYETDDAYVKLQNSGVLSDARYISEKEYAAIGATHTWGLLVSNQPTTVGFIDHIFVTDEVHVFRHKIGLSQLTADASDHFPVFVDISFQV